MKSVIASVALLFASSLACLPIGATPSTSAEKLQLHSALDEALRQVEAELLTPGPLVTDWNARGADVKALIAARTGGVEANYLLGRDKDGDRSLTIFTSGKLESIVPEGWLALADVGDIVAGTGTEIGIARIEGPYFAVIRSSTRRNGSAYCSFGPVHARLYEATGVDDAAEMDREVLQLVFRAMVRRYEKVEVCSRFDTEGSTYRTRYFFSDGRSLPRFDAYEEKSQIVPRGDVQALLVDGS